MATQAAKDPSQDEEFLSQLYKGGELLAAGKVVEAKDHLERAFKLHPKNEKAQNLLGLTYFKLGLFDRASEIYELLVRENPADPTLRVNLGLVYLKTNNLPRAVKEFETSTDLEPGHKKAHNYLGLALAQLGDYPRAREHFVIAGSDAMAEKMERAISAGAAAPVAVTPTPPPSAPPPPLPRVDAPPEQTPLESLGPPERVNDASPESLTDDAIPEDSEIVPAESLLKLPPLNGAVQSSALTALAEAAQAMGGAGKPPLPSAGFEAVPPPMASASKALLNDWGAQFGMDDAAAQGQAARSEDDMQFAEDEGPPAMPMPSLGNGEDVLATSEAAVATGAQVPVEVIEQAQAGADATAPESWDGGEAMPFVEATAEEVMVEVETGPSPTEARESDVGLGAAAEDFEAGGAQNRFDEAQDGASGVALGAAAEDFEAGGAQNRFDEAQDGASDVALSAAAEQAGAPPPEPSEIPPGLSYASDAPTALADDVPLAEAFDVAPNADGQAVEMFPDAYASQEAWPTADGAPPEAASPDWLTGGGGSPEQQARLDAQVPLTTEVPTGVTDMAMPPLPQTGYAPMATPRLEELGSSQALSFTSGELTGPFNLSPDGLSLLVNGELLARLPGLLAVVGEIDATPENRRSRGRTTDQPFGQGESQLQRVRGNGLVHLDPKGAVYQAIDLADEGAYVREERVFAFEEAVAFENARLTGQGGIGVDVVHLKGQGKVLLQLEGALKAMAIPPGTPLKVPLSRLVGWYGYVTVRVMGFVGQGAVELTGDGYVLLAA